MQKAEIAASTTFETLYSSVAGLQTQAGNSPVTTGQLIGAQALSSIGTAGGPMYIFAAAGTYKISVQYKSTSGNVKVKERQLWAWLVK